MVRIYRCERPNNEGAHCTPEGERPTNSGNFSYYAGPVGVTGVASRCVEAMAYIVWGGEPQWIFSRQRGC